MWILITFFQLPLLANGEGLRDTKSIGDTTDIINTIMFEASTNCLRPEIPFPTLYQDSYILKAVCHNIRHNCVLMNSLFQTSNESGYRKYGHTQYYGMVYGSSQRSNACSTKILSKQRYGQPKSKNTDR